MLYHPDAVVLAHIHERRRSLLAEATAHRLARRARRPSLALPDRLLAALGARLVRWGDWLQTRSRGTQAASSGAYTFERVRG